MLGRRLALLVGVLLCVVSCGLVLGGASAFALTKHLFSGAFGGEGAGNGQFVEPSGVAVNASTHDVYVVDRGNSRVELFSAGAYVGQINGSAAPTGAFSSPSAIAVDNSGNALDPSAGDVYVVDTGHNVIDKFSSAGTYLGQVTETTGGAMFGELDGIAVDAAGVVWVYQGSGEIDSFNDALGNEYLSQRSSPFGVSPGFAVDDIDDLYVNRGAQVFAKLNSSGTILSEEVDGETSTAAAVDPSNEEVFIDNVHTIGAFNSTGSLVERFGAEQGVEHLQGGSGVAVDPRLSTVYVADATADLLDVFTAVVVPDVTTGQASGLTTAAGQVTLNGVVNPDGVAVSSCEFEYGPSAAYGSVAPCAVSPGSGGAPVAVSADVTGLEPGGVYHYRLVAGNANGQSTGLDESVTAPGVALDGEWAAGVASTSATLSARINPNGSATVYRFEYGLTAAYGHSAPVPDGDAGSGAGDVTVGVHLQGLLAGSIYHYRVIAAGLGNVAGPDQTFTTQAAGGATGLADGREWEMVSPPDKHGALLKPLGPSGYLTQALPDGSAMLYTASAPVESEPQGNANLAPVLSARGVGGWASQSFEVPHETSPGGFSNEWSFFSEDLSRAVVQPAGGFPPPSSPASLSGEASEQTAFLHTNDLNGNLGEPCVTGCYRPLVTGAPGYADVLPGTVFGVALRGGGSCPPRETCGPVAIGATPDLSHVVLQSRVGLTEGASGLGLYEWAAGRLTYIAQGEAAGSFYSTSDDGSRVVFETEGGQEGLLMRDLTRGETVQLDAVQSGGAGHANPEFVSATGDGARVFFTDSQRLTSDAGASEGEPDLYECEMVVEAGALHCRLFDLTPSGAGAEHANVMGLLGTSRDGSWVYFVAGGVLGEGPGAVRGEPNLYVRHGGVTRLVAVLSSGDLPDWRRDPSGLSGEITLGTHTARVSPDGEWLAFMSQRSLTGYDNHDALTGNPDEEVYLYRAGTGALVCASCNPTGARPVGIEYVRSGSPAVPACGPKRRGSLGMFRDGPRKLTSRVISPIRVACF